MYEQDHKTAQERNAETWEKLKREVSHIAFPCDIVLRTDEGANQINIRGVNELSYDRPASRLTLWDSQGRQLATLKVHSLYYDYYGDDFPDGYDMHNVLEIRID